MAVRLQHGYSPSGGEHRYFRETEMIPLRSLGRVGAATTSALGCLQTEMERSGGGSDFRVRGVSECSLAELSPPALHDLGARMLKIKAVGIRNLAV